MQRDINKVSAKKEESQLNDERPRIKLQLNLDAILAPAHIAVVTSSEIVDFFFNAMRDADLSKKPENEKTQYKFKSHEQSAQDRRTTFESWVYAKAFQDLMRGVRGSLEETYLFQEIIQLKEAKSSTTLEQLLAPFRKRAADFNFPRLLDEVNRRLKSPLEFSDSFLSLQRARNCFEHRNGIVGRIDVDHDDVMRLNFPAVKVFYMRGGEEIEVEAGHVIDTQEVDRDEKEGVQILIRISQRHREFRLNERLSISLADFNEISFGCYQFASQLVGKIWLPTRV